MRIFPDKVLTTQKEDALIYRNVMQAFDLKPSDDQMKLLAKIKYYHLDLNMDLLRQVYDNFIILLNKLNIDHGLTEKQDSPRDGDRYMIPAHDRTVGPRKYTREQRLALRNRSRQKFWSRAVEQFGYTVERMEQELASDHSIMGKTLEPISEIIDESHKTQMSEIETHKEELQKEFDRKFVELKLGFQKQFKEYKAEFEKRLEEQQQSYEREIAYLYELIMKKEDQLGPRKTRRASLKVIS